MKSDPSSLKTEKKTFEGSMDNPYQARSGYLCPGRVIFSKNTIFVILRGNLDRASVPGLRRTSTFSPSWIFKFLAPVLRVLVSVLDICSRRPWTKTRTSAMTVLTGKTDSKIQDGEDFDVLRSSGWGPN